jgi:hypothetical protein
MMEEKTISFDLSLKHNFIRAIRQSMQNAKHLKPEQKQFEQMHSKATIDEYECDETA